MDIPGCSSDIVDSPEIDTADINVMLSANKKALIECEEKMNVWKNQMSEYQALKENLEKLPRDITHDVMVPFGTCAFMPGKMIHTNEILVLLGDNWFCSRSACQAVEIVMRRLDYCEKMLSKFEQERQFYVEKIKFIQSDTLAGELLLTSDDDGSRRNDENLVEIREPLSSDDINITLNRKKRKRESNVSLEPIDEEALKNGEMNKLTDDYDDTLKGEELENHEKIVHELEHDLDTLSSDTPKVVSDEEYQELMTRLDELMKREEQEDDAVRSDNDDSDKHSSSAEEELMIMDKVRTNESQKICDLIIDHVDDETAECDNRNDDSSGRKSNKKVTWNESREEKSPEDEDAPSKEADIVLLKYPSDDHLNCCPPKKSILKNRRESSPIDHAMLREIDEKPKITVLPGSLEAFTGIIREKPVNSPTDTVSPITSEPPTPRRQSKFRVQRASVQ